MIRRPRPRPSTPVREVDVVRAILSRGLSAGSFVSVAVGALLLLSACGTSTPTQQPAGTGGGGGGTATALPKATEGASTTTTGGTAAAGGGTGSPQAEAVAKQLVPPNSTEIQKTTAEATWFAVYESTASIDTLRAFYEKAIPKTGLRIISTTTVGGGVSFAVTIDDAASFGGAVNIYPGSDGKTGVQVAIGKT